MINIIIWLLIGTIAAMIYLCYLLINRKFPIEFTLGNVIIICILLFLGPCGLLVIIGCMLGVLLSFLIDNFDTPLSEIFRMEKDDALATQREKKRAP